MQSSPQQVKQCKNRFVDILLLFSVPCHKGYTTSTLSTIPIMNYYISDDLYLMPLTNIIIWLIPIIIIWLIPIIIISISVQY